MNLTIVIKSVINPDKVPDFFGIKPFVVITGSMEPVISGGDLVMTKTIHPAAVRPNDIISYKSGNSIITHRVIEIIEQNDEIVFITKGDANNSADEVSVKFAQVESIYLFRIKKLGNLAMFMQTPLGIIVFFGIPLCAFIIYDIIRRRFTDKAANDGALAEIERLKAKLAQKENGGHENSVNENHVEETPETEEENSEDQDQDQDQETGEKDSD